VATAVGERRAVDLPDGSQVVLGAASKLGIDTAYGHGSRRVYLEGQALFRVTHDSTRPFVVHAAGTLAEDLGTEFDVRAYPGDSTVRVAVIEGAVSVRRAQANDSATLLRPRDVARIDATGGAAPVVLHDQDVERLVAWTAGELNFRDATLTEVARELERWFDVEVRVTSESIAGTSYTADRLSLESLDELLRVIDLSLPNVIVDRQGRLVTFSPGAGVGRLVPPAPPRSSRVEAGA
jgi:transmembrane sensor